MALSDVLNNLTGARDALVTAINNKGGSVATTATIRQCAEAVTALPDGGGAWEAPEGAVLYLPLSAPFGLNPTGTVGFGYAGNKIYAATFYGDACFNLQTNPLSGTGDFSISIWEKFDELNANELSQAFFFGTVSSGQSIGLQWQSEYGQLSLNTWSSDELNIPITVNNSTWHHICAVYSDGLLKCFVDSVLYDSVSIYMNITGDASYVGGQFGNSERNWVGHLAALRVYERALTNSEISELFNEF